MTSESRSGTDSGEWNKHRGGTETLGEDELVRGCRIKSVRIPLITTPRGLGGSLLVFPADKKLVRQAPGGETGTKGL